MKDSDVRQMLIYQSESGQTRLEVRLSGGGLVDSGADGGIVSDFGGQYQFASLK